MKGTNLPKIFFSLKNLLSTDQVEMSTSSGVKRQQGTLFLQNLILKTDLLNKLEMY